MTEPSRSPESGQFGLSAMLMLLLVVGVAASIAFYLVQSQFAASVSARLNSQFLFIMLTLSAPMLLMVLVSLIHGLIGWLSGRR